MIAQTGRTYDRTVLMWWNRLKSTLAPRAVPHTRVDRQGPGWNKGNKPIRVGVVFAPEPHFQHEPSRIHAADSAG